MEIVKLGTWNFWGLLYATAVTQRIKDRVTLQHTLEKIYRKTNYGLPLLFKEIRNNRGYIYDYFDDTEWKFKRVRLDSELNEVQNEILTPPGLIDPNRFQTVEELFLALMMNSNILLSRVLTSYFHAKFTQNIMASHVEEMNLSSAHFSIGLVPSFSKKKDRFQVADPEAGETEDFIRIDGVSLAHSYTTKPLVEYVLKKANYLVVSDKPIDETLEFLKKLQKEVSQTSISQWINEGVKVEIHAYYTNDCNRRMIFIKNGMEVMLPRAHGKLPNISKVTIPTVTASHLRLLTLDLSSPSKNSMERLFNALKKVVPNEEIEKVYLSHERAVLRCKSGKKYIIDLENLNMRVIN